MLFDNNVILERLCTSNAVPRCNSRVSMTRCFEVRWLETCSNDDV